MVAGLALLLRTPWHPWGDDFAGYLLQAHAIAAGDMGPEALRNGALIAASDSFPAPAAYPWGFPTLLWIKSWVGGWELMPLKVIGALSLGIASAFTFALARSFLSRSGGVLASALVGLQPELLRSADLLLSDLPFLAVVAVALYQMDRSYRKVAADGSRGGVWLAAVLAVAGITIRAAGLVVPVTFMLMYGYLWVANPGRRAGILKSGALYGCVVAGLAALYLGWSPGNPNGTYVKFITVAPRSILTMAVQTGLQAWSFVPFTFLPSSSKGLMVLTTVVGVGLVVLGIRARRVSGSGLALFGLLSFGLLLVFPFVQGTRFLYPLLIPGVILGLSGVSSAWASPHNPIGRSARLSRRVETAAPLLAGCLVALMMAQGYGLGGRPMGYDLDGPYSAESRELARFIAESLPPDAQIAFFRPRALRLLTGRPAIAISEPRSWASYFVVNKWVTPDSEGLLAKYQVGAEYFAEHAAEYERQFENGQFVLYRVIGSRSAPR